MTSRKALAAVITTIVVVAAAVVIAIAVAGRSSTSVAGRGRTVAPAYRITLSQLLASTEQGCITAFGPVAKVNALTGQQFNQVEVVTPPDGKADVCTYDQKITDTSNSNELSVELYTPAVDVKGSTADGSYQVVARKDGILLRIETVGFLATPALKTYAVSALDLINLHG